MSSFAGPDTFIGKVKDKLNNKTIRRVTMGVLFTAALVLGHGLGYNSGVNDTQTSYYKLIGRFIQNPKALNTHENCISFELNDNVRSEVTITGFSKGEKVSSKIQELYGQVMVDGQPVSNIVGTLTDNGDTVTINKGSNEPTITACLRPAKIDDVVIAK